MKKVVVLSITSIWLQKVLNGIKKYEIRKSFPSVLKNLFLDENCQDEIEVHLYCTTAAPFLFREDMSDDRFIDTKPYQLTKVKNKYLEEDDAYLNGKIVAKFILRKIDKFDVPYPAFFHEVEEKLKPICWNSCLTLTDLHHYLKNETGYAWHIEDLEIFDDDELKTLKDYGLLKAPQSYCYAEI